MAIIQLILIFYIIQVYHSQIVFRPIYSNNTKYPFVLSHSDNDYYVITSKKGLIINKVNGNIVEYNQSFEYSNETIYCIDKSNNNFLYHSQQFYQINVNQFILKPESNPITNNGNYLGSITFEDHIVVYGLDIDKFLYLKKEDNNNIEIIIYNDINNIKRVSCKIFYNPYFICAMIIEKTIQIKLLKNHNKNKLDLNTIIYFSNKSKEYINCALYDTTLEKTKILCKQQNNNNKKINCHFLEITFDNSENSGSSERIGNRLTFIPGIGDFTEKDCCLSEFNNEYLFCCGINNFIICYRINQTDFNIIKQFNISIFQRNSYLSIIPNNLTATFIFMNNEDKVYEYKIYIPFCNNKEYSMFRSLNENKTEKSMERLRNLFVVKTNNTFLKFENAPYDFGYFILNQNTTINNSSKININDNDYIIDFIITNKETMNFTNVTINYSIFVEYSEAYTAQCQIKFNFLFSTSCYYSCSECQYYKPNETHHYCIKCHTGYYFLENTTNCYDMNFTENGYYLDNFTYNEFGKIEPIFKKCYKSCKTCSKYNEIKEDKKENHNCLKCADNYYNLENGYPSNCYKNGTTNTWNSLEYSTINTINTVEIKKEIDSEIKTSNLEESDYKGESVNISDNFIEKKSEETEDMPEKISTIYIYGKEISNTETIYECDISCLICYNNNKSNCLQCNIEKGYYPLYNDNSSCYSNNSIIKGYYLDINIEPYIWRQCNETYEKCNIFITSDGDCVQTCPNGTFKNPLNNSCLESCPDNNVYNDVCIPNINKQEILISEFKNKILSNINSYKNSTQFINDSNFIAAVFSSDNMNTEEQIKNGISAIDLGNCTQIIKEYYNISQHEDLIIFNIETKNESNNYNGNSFNLEKNTQIEIYDMSGTPLDLSMCEEDIKVMKYIGDVKELDIKSAISLSEQGIDVFDASNEFFNDICHPYYSPDGKDIILTDRRKDIYQNATFCQYGCSYLGMNYNLMVANCKCGSSVLQGEDKNKT